MRYNLLSQMKVKSLGEGKHNDGQGLYLVKKHKQGGKWIQRLSVNGKRREMGLGRWPDVSIGEAREKASEARKQLRGGIDPIIERRKIVLIAGGTTVADVIEGCFEARKAELKNDGAAGRWLSPLKVHIIPKIGKLPIEQLDQHILTTVVGPI
ncbi:MAG: Arm DNA-binding domain-containing protein, partial [Parasphingorhabdus sp.]